VDSAMSSDEFRKTVKQRGFHRLLRPHKVYLYALPSIPEKEAQRFARLFVETWKRIRLGPRRAILRHWRDDRKNHTLTFSPWIELSSSWTGQEVRRGGHGLRGTKANTSSRGHKLRFWSKIVAVYPDNLVQDLIAHELAHVYQWATDRQPEGFDDAMLVEEDADWLMRVWRFDLDAMDYWDAEYGIIKMIDTDYSTPAGKRALARSLDRILRTGR
jgi:hypothetical protein